MNELEEQHMCVKFCNKLGKHFAQTFQLLNQAYGEDCMNRKQCYEPLNLIKEGRMSIGEDPRPGRPSASTNDDHIERFRAMIRENSRLSVREFVDEGGISIGSCHQIFNEKIQMRRFSSKFVLTCIACIAYFQDPLNK